MVYWSVSSASSTSACAAAVVLRVPWSSGSREPDKSFVLANASRAQDPQSGGS